MDSTMSTTSNTMNRLNDTWSMYAHLPHDTDWSIDSYKLVHIVEHVEEVVKLLEDIPDNVITNCMMFFMRKGIKPIWEDERNRDGGCFSLKIPAKKIVEAWRAVCFAIAGETISDNTSISQSVTGATISPKKGFCILKVWVSNCDNTDASIFSQTIPGLDFTDYVFKKHSPDY